MKTILSIPIVILASVFGFLALPQTSSFTVGNFTLDTTGSPVITVQSPTRAGRLALLTDIPITPPGVNIIAGSATLVNGLVTVTIPAQTAPPICVAIDVTAASPVRRVAVTATAVSFEGVSNHAIDYVCAPKNN
jgi:hypothetical protein